METAYGDSSNPDRLTKYGYDSVSYNSYGYPTRYGDKIYVWDKGKLVKIYDDIDENSSNSSDTYEFSYNAYGQRISKRYTYDPGPDYSDNFLIGYYTTYTYDSFGRLIREIREEDYTASASITYETLYLYDESEAIGFILKCDDVDYGTYYYHKNIQGDITEIYDSTGTVVVKYAYDAFGNCQTVYGSISRANEYNSLRYRGYYYDSDTKLYYLNARYYNPEWRRFISPDETAYLDPENPNGLNLYAYCNNDPVNYSDPGGQSAIAAVLIGLGIGTILGIGYAAHTDYQDDSEINGSIGWQRYLGYSIIGGAIGAGIGYWGPALASFLGNSFSFSIGMLDAGGALIFETINVTGAQLVGGAVAAGIGIMLFSKGFGPRMGHNQHEKQMWNEAMNQLDINDKDLIRRLHDEVHKYPYQDKLKGLLKVLREILTNWGKL